jgi:hypothetical protein
MDTDKLFLGGARDGQIGQSRQSQIIQPAKPAFAGAIRAASWNFGKK